MVKLVHHVAEVLRLAGFMIMVSSDMESFVDLAWNQNASDSHKRSLVQSTPCTESAELPQGPEAVAPPWQAKETRSMQNIIKQCVPLRSPAA